MNHGGSRHNGVQQQIVLHGNHNPDLHNEKSAQADWQGERQGMPHRHAYQCSDGTRLDHQQLDYELIHGGGHCQLPTVAVLPAYVTQPKSKRCKRQRGPPNFNSPFGGMSAVQAGKASATGLLRLDFLAAAAAEAEAECQQHAALTAKRERSQSDEPALPAFKLPDTANSRRLSPDGGSNCSSHDTLGHSHNVSDSPDALSTGAGLNQADAIFTVAAWALALSREPQQQKEANPSIEEACMGNDAASALPAMPSCQFKAKQLLQLMGSHTAAMAFVPTPVQHADAFAHMPTATPSVKVPSAADDSVLVKLDSCSRQSSLLGAPYNALEKSGRGKKGGKGQAMPDRPENSMLVLPSLLSEPSLPADSKTQQHMDLGSALQLAVPVQQVEAGAKGSGDGQHVMKDADMVAGTSDIAMDFDGADRLPSQELVLQMLQQAFNSQLMAGGQAAQQAATHATESYGSPPSAGMQPNQPVPSAGDAAAIMHAQAAAQQQAGLLSMGLSDMQAPPAQQPCFLPMAQLLQLQQLQKHLPGLTQQPLEQQLLTLHVVLQQQQRQQQMAAMVMHAQLQAHAQAHAQARMQLMQVHGSHMLARAQADGQTLANMQAHAESSLRQERQQLMLRLAQMQQHQETSAYDFHTGSMSLPRYSS